jgi:23S rRNA pseudouridine2605 synthase
MIERLQKIIARAGVASRRHAEEMIASGLVTVNGATVTELGTKADASKDHIKVSGKLLRPEAEHVYLILNKPPEVVSTMSDPEGRPSLRDFLHGVSQRVFPVGRLEYHSGGLVLLTNDGDLANRLLRAHRLQQTYQLKLKTLLTFAEIQSFSRLCSGRISRLRGKDAPWYEVTLSGARRDTLRGKLFQSGHFVEKMTRVGIGNLALGLLARGSYRELSAAEVSALSRAIDESATGKPWSQPGDRKRTAGSAPSKRLRPKPKNHEASARPGKKTLGSRKIHDAQTLRSRPKPRRRTR